MITQRIAFGIPNSRPKAGSTEKPVRLALHYEDGFIGKQEVPCWRSGFYRVWM